jgi:H+/Cl- antiporter ClcA
MADVLFPGLPQLGPCFRGGPVFPALFLGGAAGLALDHLPGRPAVAVVGMRMGAMMTAMLRRPMTSALLAVVLLSPRPAR